jgi:hypothetical protein
LIPHRGLPRQPGHVEAVALADQRAQHPGDARVQPLRVEPAPPWQGPPRPAHRPG